MGILNNVGYALAGTITRVGPAAASLQTTSCCVVAPARSFFSSKGLLKVKSLLSFTTRTGHESKQLTEAHRFYFFGLLGRTSARSCTTSTVSFSRFSKCLWRTILKPRQCLFNSRSTLTTNPNLPKDVLVYSHKNDKFYQIVSGFGLCQMLLWGYFSLFAVQDLRASPTSKKDTSDLPWWKYLLYKEGQYKNALSVLCFSIGGIVLFMTMAYPRRAVRNLWLLKGGSEIQITTYSWFGQTHTFKIPLEHVSFVQSRTGSGHNIPFKVKGKYFYYLIDKQGSFHNTNLFDFVIGFKRKFQ